MVTHQGEVLAGTGHRPDQLGGYHMVPDLVVYAKRILSSYNPSKLITGMALGWDQALAVAAKDLRIPYIAAVPFEGQESLWRPTAKAFYHELLAAADEVVIVCEGPFAPWKFIRRDEWMVDHADAMLALWNGRMAGGTYRCIKYAEQVQRPIYNVWPEWKSIIDAAVTNF